MTIKKFHKPLPYLVQGDTYPVKEAAGKLRDKFRPLMQKRLPTVYYSGWKHDFIPSWVQKNKSQYPFFLKMDVAKFYPSVSHHHLTVEVQLAYKKLLGLSYVPKQFKQEFLPAVHAFYQSLPYTHAGLPLNSAMSKTLAPMFLVPFFIDLKSNVNIKFIVYADDVLVMARSKRDLESVYIDFTNHLHSLGLHLNLDKLEQGRFADSVLNFCGYRFAGGAVGVSKVKVELFKQRIAEYCSRSFSPFNERSFIKSLNVKIRAFAHYYKFGKVVGLYQELDAFVRAQVRMTYKKHAFVYPGNKHLSALGLSELSSVLNGQLKKIIEKKIYESVKLESRRNPEVTHAFDVQVIAYLEHFDYQNKQLIELMKQLLLVNVETRDSLRAA